MKTTKILIFSILTLTLAIGLIYFAYLGYFTRYWQDDWCYNADFQQLGFWGTINGYFYITTYASNRFSLTLFSGFLYYLGIFGVQILPTIIIFTLSAANYWLIGNVTKLFKRDYSNWLIAILALAVTFFTIFIAPDRFQSFYWRSAILPYTFPLLFFIIWAAIISGIVLNPSKTSPWLTVLLVIISFFGSGFSEAGGAFFFSGATITFLLFIWYKQFQDKTHARGVFITLSLSLLASFSALIIMLLSPANAPRQLIYSEPSSFMETIILSIQFGFYFMIDSIKSYPLPHLALLILVFSTSYLFKGNKDQSPSTASFLKKIFWVLIAGIMLILALQAPSAYIEGSPPADRALVIGRWYMLFILSLTAWLTADFLASILKSKLLEILMPLVVLLSTIYVARAIYNTFDYHQPRFEKIALVWDERDQLIREEKKKGEEIIEVRPVDSQYLGGGVLDFHPDPNWVNICAAEYYQVKEILGTKEW